MKIKKFIASSMKEAITQIKNEFGDDAIILSQKKIKVKDQPENPDAVEVTAAIDKKESNEQQVISEFSPMLKQSVSGKSTVGQISNFQIDAMQKELEYLSERMEILVNHIKYENLPHIPKSLQKKVRNLIGNGIRPSLANSLIEELVLNLKGEDFLNEELIDEKLILKIKNMMQVSGPVKFNKDVSTVIVLIGPTGVGKTTVAAKLAAMNKYKAGKNVALVSADSYRIAAKEQLRAFADIAKIRFESVYNPSDLTHTINSLQDYDLIIIDTAGINPKDMKKMVALKDMIKVSKADEIHLIVSITEKEDYIRENIRGFTVLNYSSLIYTKIDETLSFGEILNISSDFDKKISYLTNGQSIPEDIIIADRKDIAMLILRGNNANN